MKLIYQRKMLDEKSSDQMLRLLGRNYWDEQAISEIPPHIFVEVDPNSSLCKDESFGPVLPVIKAQNEAHALELANDTDFGLSSAVCSADYDRGLQFALKIDAGMTHVNGITVADQANAPFGGEKNSGLGRFNGQWILEEFTRTHWITVPKDQ